MGDAADQPKKAKPGMKAPTLAEVQARFQQAVVAGDDSILDLIPGNSRTNSTVLLGVYRYAYMARLVDIVASDHAGLKAYMGDEAFDAMAHAYITAHPSHTPNARWVAEALPEFLAASEPYSAHPELAALARLERALADAFDAPDAPVLDLAALARHAPERWGDLVLTGHPSVTRLDLERPILPLWRAMKDGNPPPKTSPAAERERLLAWRNDTKSSVRVLGAEEAMLWDEAMQGARFGALCELAATYDDPDGAALRAAQYLQGWITSGMLTAAKLARRRRRAAVAV